MKRYIYHYCATYREMDSDYSIDGILISEHKVDTMERYREIKKTISPTRTDLVIRSLSFLHQTTLQGDSE